jgi:hypothetical protein
MAIGVALAMVIAPMLLFLGVMRYIGMKEKTELRRLQQGLPEGDKQ